MRRASIRSIDVAITSSDGEVQPATDRICYSGIERTVYATAERHSGNRGTSGGLELVVGIVDTADNISVGAGARVGQD